MKKKLLLVPLTIAIVGTAIWFFLFSLSLTIGFFQSHWMYLVPLLPLAAGLHAWIDRSKEMHRIGNTDTLIEEIRHPQKPVHWFLAPWIYLMTLLFHLFGGTVGRESTAVQIGASLAESSGRLLKIPIEDRPILLRMGLSAGFGAAFGIPWAGALFGLEFPRTSRLKDWLHAPLYLACSWGADRWARLLGTPHLVFKIADSDLKLVNGFSFQLLVLGLTAVTLGYEILFRQSQTVLRRWPWWTTPLLGGFLILILTFTAGGPAYNNLGIAFILSSFEEPARFTDAVVKLLFTWISVATGMKGGEVTPLMAAGALLGSSIANFLGMAAFQIGAAIGLVSLFSSRLRIPLTGILMLWEIFDWKIALLGAPTLLLIELGHRKLISKSS